MAVDPHLPETIDGKAVQSLKEARAIRSATVCRERGGWAVLVCYGSFERMVAAQRAPTPRLWRTLGGAAAFVRDQLGLSRFEVDNGGPDTGTTHRRPGHQAAAHERWFREQIEIAVKEAEDPNAEWIQHDVVRAEWERERAALLAQIQHEQNS